MSSRKPASRSWSLAASLTTWYTSASFLLILITTGILYWGLSRGLNRSEDLFLADKVHVLRAILRDQPGDQDALREEVELESEARRYAQFYERILDETGSPVMTTSGMDALLPASLFPRPYPADAEPGRGLKLRNTGKRSFWAIAARAHVGQSGGKTWTLQIAVDRNNDQLLLANYREWLWGVLAIAMIICPLAGFRIARRGTRPMREIAATARRTGSETLNARIEPQGYPVELAALAETFNAMLDRLEDSFRRLSQFSADIAHELRTPMNNMRGEAEVALSRARSVEEYREALTSCLEESVRLSDLIENLLFLARAESPGMQLKREPVQVVRDLGAICEYYEAAAAECKVTLSTRSGEEVVYPFDRSLLQRALGNLVVNALDHTPPGGAVWLSAVADRGRVRIEVSDTGCGIPAEDLPRVFDRFYRADRARSSQFGGVGLGLAIVKGIVTLHGGWTEVESQVGKGTRIVLSFPVGSHAK